MQQKLSSEALQRARLTIEKTFHDPTTLEELGGLAFQLEKQLSIVEGQLNGAVQTKLDSLKRAVDLMDESVLKLSKVSTNIQKIDEKISMTNTAISNYPNLKRVHNAKENLTKVIDQVDFFAHVPEEVEKLSQKLQEKPLTLKEVFLEATKLESLRAALMREIKVSRNRRYSVAGVSTGDYSEETSRSVSEAIDRHLKIVPALMKEIREMLLETVDHMFEIADTSPELLVMTFEVIEMQQEYNDRRNQQLLKRREQQSKPSSQSQARDNHSNTNSNSNATNTNHPSAKPGLAKSRTVTFSPENSNSNSNSSVLSDPSFQPPSSSSVVVVPPVRGGGGELYENLIAIIESKLRRMFDEISEAELSNYLSYLNEMNGSHVAVIRWIGTQILTKIKYFQTSVLPCLPPHYDALFVFLESFDAYLLPKLQEIVATLSNLKVSEILDLISWFEFLQSSIVDFGFANRDSLQDYNNLKTELSLEYKERIKSQVHSWFKNIKNQELEITKSTDNTLISSNPEDMFNIIHAQLNVAKEKLPPEYIKEVAIACLQVLQDVQRQSYDSLLHHYQSMEAEVLCAVINDHQRMEEKCREFSEEVMRFMVDDLDREVLEAITNEVATEYLLIANQGCLSLARCILEVMDEPIFSRLFSSDWEQSSNQDSLMTTLVITIQDYLDDLSEWLTYYHYTKLVKELLLLIVGHYLMALRRKANGVYTFTNELVVANKIIHDRTILSDYFSKHKEVLQRGGLRATKRSTNNPNNTNNSTSEAEQALNEALEPLYCFAKIVSSHTLIGIESDAKELFSRYGIDGLKVVQSCYLCNPCISRNERGGFVEGVKKLFEDNNHVVKGADGHSTTVYSTVPLPDYQNYDAAIANLPNVVKEASQKRGFFWTSKKK